MLYAIMASLAGPSGERQPKCDGFDMIKPSFHSFTIPGRTWGVVGILSIQAFQYVWHACVFSPSLSWVLRVRTGFRLLHTCCRMDLILSDRRGFQKLFILPGAAGAQSRLLKLYRGSGSGVWQNWEWSRAGTAR